MIVYHIENVSVYIICGLFNQHETNCLSSNNIIKNINITNNTNTPNKISVIMATKITATYLGNKF